MVFVVVSDTKDLADSEDSWEYPPSMTACGKCNR